MASKEKRLTLDIKGRQWTFILMSDRAFDKKHNSNEKTEENSNAAMTCPTIYEVHFRKSDWNIITIRHEIGHILFQMSLTNSSNMDAEQVEETMCEILGNHCSEVVLWSDRIAERFFEE